jgi:hypothetical protein
MKWLVTILFETRAELGFDPELTCPTTLKKNERRLSFKNLKKLGN